MPKWIELQMRYVSDYRLQVELAAHAWRQAAAYGDDALMSTLAINTYNVAGICDTLDWRGIPPDEATIEWARQRGKGMPPPVPFMVFRG